MLRLIIIAVLLLSLPAAAQTNCKERSTFIGPRSDPAAQQPVGRGLSSRNALVELLVSTDGSWKIIVTRPNGISCVLGSGGSWTDVLKQTEGPKV